jgi:hypothetical protein
VLGRQYAFTENIEIVVVVEEDDFIQELVNALQNAPITCGDSESIATIENIKPFLKTHELDSEIELETKFPIPFDFQKIEIVNGFGQLYLIHERCQKKDKNFPLVNYLFPLREKNSILYPTELTIKIKQPVSILGIENMGKVIKSV